MLTTVQRERYLGMLLQGTSPQTARDVLELSEAEIYHETVVDPEFRKAVFRANAARHCMIREWERMLPDDGSPRQFRLRE